MEYNTAGWLPCPSLSLGVCSNACPLSHADDTTLMAESEEELKSSSMKVKEESEKSGLKRNIQKTKIMASSPNLYITAININPTSLTLNI